MALECVKSYNKKLQSDFANCHAFCSKNPACYVVELGVHTMQINGLIVKMHTQLAILLKPVVDLP